MKLTTNLVCALALCVGALLGNTPVFCAEPAVVPTLRGRIEVAPATNASETKAHGKKVAEAGAGETIGGRVGNAKVRSGAIPATVVWLTAAPGSDVRLDAPPPADGASARLVQKNKSFEPRLLVIPAGSMVEFPNRDPFFHNVFSLFEGKRFDLGLYEAGTTRAVRFDRPGISYVFCNIHPEMSAVVITMGTPLYATAGKDGQLSIANVPYGRYTLHIWSQGMGPENDQSLTRDITIGENSTSLGVIKVPEADGQRIAHKNKYGREYDQPTPDNSIYQQR